MSFLKTSHSNNSKCGGVLWATTNGLNRHSPANHRVWGMAAKALFAAHQNTERVKVFRKETEDHGRRLGFSGNVL